MGLACFTRNDMIEERSLATGLVRSDMSEQNEKKKPGRLTLETAHSKLDPVYSGSSEYDVQSLQFGF